MPNALPDPPESSHSESHSRDSASGIMTGSESKQDRARAHELVVEAAKSAFRENKPDQAFENCTQELRKLKVELPKKVATLLKEGLDLASSRTTLEAAEHRGKRTADEIFGKIS